jgi:hypothetical protein
MPCEHFRLARALQAFPLGSCLARKKKSLPTGKLFKFYFFLLPYGGITRIKFKGSSPRLSQLSLP